jgi:hypothetical protein
MPLIAISKEAALNIYEIVDHINIYDVSYLNIYIFIVF